MKFWHQDHNLQLVAGAVAVARAKAKIKHDFFLKGISSCLFPLYLHVTLKQNWRSARKKRLKMQMFLGGVSSSVAPVQAVYFLGCWMIRGLFIAVFSSVGSGFSWKDFTASLGKASSSPVAAPDTTTFFLSSFSTSSFGFSTGFSLSLTRGFVTTLIPPTF